MPGARHALAADYPRHPAAPTAPFRLTEPLAFAVHVGPSNQVRKEFGVPASTGYLRVMYTEGNSYFVP
jgi:hypothetical protein